MTPEWKSHVARRDALTARMRSNAVPGGVPLGLVKRSSNLFRDRSQAAKQRLDLGDFCHVLEINAAQGWVDVEGMATYEELVAQTLPQGVMPAVVPQLKTITVGGAVAGVGIEATSHAFGLVHNTLLELDVLLPGGDVVHCTPDNEHQDLFLGFPNSYGTLGYGLRLRLRTLAVKPFVRVEHVQHYLSPDFFGALQAHCRDGASFVDAVVFSAQQQVISAASFVDTAPWLSDYRFEHIYYGSILDKGVDYLRVQDYLWRWDTDWFWCSKNLGAQHPLVRRLLGPSRLNSRTYQRVMRWNARWGVTRRLARLRGRYPESVIQDVDIPLAGAAEFLAFLLREIGILPIWICPVRTPESSPSFTLYPMVSNRLYVNFGFWDVIESETPREAGHFNRMIERAVVRLGGIKSLYSESYFTRDEFAQTYAMARYQDLKEKYDPDSRMLGLYEKCVLGA